MHAETFMSEVASIASKFDWRQIEMMAEDLSRVEGRIYLVGLGGSLANCSHMAADLRKLCGIDAVAPESMAELTAWANDERWNSLFVGYLERCTNKDALFVLSVGGGTSEVSIPILRSVMFADKKGMKIFGIVGPKGGETAKVGDCVIRIPVDNPKHVTPHTEAFQAVVWHCLVSHPLLQKRPTKW